ncbi:UNVERIFIED_CONTAM: hypothetical protein PYX00_004441 [Menopon gallinae]|uniref:non-specific serine/threonine protein kinase n=1 Tax=Menopon gallinae TaxID=328185 RepID=A0AAW2I4G8_9NEOP
MDKYNFSKEIGRGSFGKVYLIESRQTGIQYVLKQIDLNKMDKKQVKTASKEVEVLSKLKHSHIVRYKESYEIGDRLNIIMEYCENGDLHKKIKEKRVMNECFSDNEIFDYFVQICLAVEYIHEQKILHRDLKTKNIFLTKGNLVKLGDFGVAKVLENSFELASTCIGSPYYISPEICENKPYNKKSDIWALGCVLYELATLKYAFVAKNVKILIAKISTGTFNPLPVNVNPVLKSLLINMLKPNPKDRPTASEILRKPFLNKFKCKYSPECSILRKRSSSGDNSKKCFKLNNEVKILSTSCTNVNDKNRYRDITKPETKYKVPFFNNRFKSLKKNTDGKSSTGSERLKEDLSKGVVAEKKNWETMKTVKLLKVDSEYYNMIAESNRLKSVDSEIEKECSSDQETKSEDHIPSTDHCRGTVGQTEEVRRRWMANTLEKKELLTILSEAELIDITLVKAPEMIALGNFVLFHLHYQRN